MSSDDSNGIETANKALPEVPLQVIYGDAKYLSRASVNFTILLTVTPATRGGLWSSVNLYDQPGLTRWLNGRASALVSYPLTVSFLVNREATASAISFSGAVAVLADVPAFNLDEVPAAARTAGAVVSIDGSDSFVGSDLLKPMCQVHRGIGVQDEVLITQVIGHKPRFLLAGSSSGVATLQVLISGTVSLHGIGPISPF
jgi:hypothetical protein